MSDALEKSLSPVDHLEVIHGWLKHNTCTPWMNFESHEFLGFEEHDLNNNNRLDMLQDYLASNRF